MDALSKLIKNLIYIDHQQLSLLSVIDMLENYCEENRMEDMFLLLCHLELSISGIRQLTNESINFLDQTLLDIKHQSKGQ